jgi:para-nitrobenzyl esterase
VKARTSESAGVASLSDPKRRVALKGLAATTAGAILPALNSCAFTSSATSPVVETRAGKLRGTNVSGVEVFKGVRYADTTAATNRFMPPGPG